MIGVTVVESLDGLSIAACLPGGPADAAGLLSGDLVLKIVTGHTIQSVRKFTTALTCASGHTVKCVIRREGEQDRLKLKFPVPDALSKAKLGLKVLKCPDGGGVQVEAVVPLSPVAVLQKDDIILKVIHSQSLSTRAGFEYLASTWEVGDSVTLHVKRDDQTIKKKIQVRDVVEVENERVAAEAQKRREVEEPEESEGGTTPDAVEVKQEPTERRPATVFGISKDVAVLGLGSAAVGLASYFVYLRRTVLLSRIQAEMPMLNSRLSDLVGSLKASTVGN